MWLNEVQGFQTDAAHHYPINFTTLNLTTGKGLSLGHGPRERVLMFNRFSLSCVNAGGKYRFHTANITLVILGPLPTNDQTASILSIRFPFVTVISTNSLDFWDIVTKRCSLTVSFGYLIHIVTMIGSKRALEGKEIDF